MKSALKTMAVAAAFAGLMAASASAATLSLLGFTGDNTDAYESKTLTGSYNLLEGGGGSISFLTGTVKDTTNGLQVTGPGKPYSITFTYIGSEAGNTNYSANIGGTIFLNKPFGSETATAVNTSVTFLQTAAGLIDFSFGTYRPNSAVGTIANDGGASRDVSTYSIGYKLFNNNTSAYVYFDDIAATDRDFDDLVMRIDVAPVPVPAAGFLLLGALGGLAALRRRKAA